MKDKKETQASLNRDIKIAEIILTITSSFFFTLGILCHFKIIVLGEGFSGTLFFIIGGFQGGAALYSFLSGKQLRKNK